MTKINIFVFGSNEAGIHGAGAAKAAKKDHGAMYGIGVGLCGRSYAIPTKDKKIKTLPLDKIEQYVKQFLDFARECLTTHPEYEFNVTRIGCGLAGYKNSQIAPLFKNAPINCKFDKEWDIYLMG